jgi:hypothetical protein
MNLAEQYEKLLAEYDRVLSLSEQILDGLKRGAGEIVLDSLLQKKKTAGENIAQLTRHITASEIEGRSVLNSGTLSLMKDLFKQVKQRAQLLQQVEDQIKDVLQQKDSKSN